MGNMFLKMLEIDNIERVIKLCVKGKRGGIALRDIQYYPRDYAYLLRDIIIGGKWWPAQLESKAINDKGKQREIILAPIYPDRIIHRLVADAITPELRRSLIRDTYQSLKGRGSHKAIKRLKSWIASYPEPCEIYYLQVDVCKYYPSIDGEILKAKLHKRLYDSEVLKLLDSFINSCGGVYLGSSLSQILANYYLNDLDHLLKEQVKVKHYIRYCDDIVVLHTDKDYLRAVARKIDNEVRALKLELHPIKVHKLTSGLDFLGYNIYPYHTKVRRAIKHSYYKALSRGRLKSLASVAGWLLLSNDKGRGIIQNVLKYTKSKRGIHE